jgi:hypothetical protein
MTTCILTARIVALDDSKRFAKKEVDGNMNLKEGEDINRAKYPKKKCLDFGYPSGIRCGRELNRHFIKNAHLC